MASLQTITRSVTISSGESFTLPNGATVVSITDTLSNTCGITLPDPEPLVDYEYTFSINQDDSDEHPVGGYVNIESVLIDGTSITLAFTGMNTDNSGNSGDVGVWSGEIVANNNILSSQPVKFVSITYSAGVVGSISKSDLVTVVMKMPESYLSKVFLKITNDKFPNGFYLLGSL